MWHCSYFSVVRKMYGMMHFLFTCIYMHMILLCLPRAYDLFTAFSFCFIITAIPSHDCFRLHSWTFSSWMQARPILVEPLLRISPWYVNLIGLIITVYNPCWSHHRPWVLRPMLGQSSLTEALVLRMKSVSWPHPWWSVTTILTPSGLQSFGLVHPDLITGATPSAIFCICIA